MTKKILVIDNEQYIREITQMCLKTIAKWDVITASSGTEGINTAEIEQPDAILLDVMMPDLDGITTFKMLQNNEKTKHIPVILLTAKVQASDRQHYTELGLKDAIAKPFNPLDLPLQIIKILGWNGN